MYMSVSTGMFVSMLVWLLHHKPFSWYYYFYACTTRFASTGFVFHMYCMYVDDSRTAFLDNGGCEQLAAVLKSYGTLPISVENEKLKCVICGCLSNTCSEQNGMKKLCKQFSHYYVQY